MNPRLTRSPRISNTLTLMPLPMTCFFSPFAAEKQHLNSLLATEFFDSAGHIHHGRERAFAELNASERFAIDHSGPFHCTYDSRTETGSDCHSTKLA